MLFGAALMLPLGWAGINPMRNHRGCIGPTMPPPVVRTLVECSAKAVVKNDTAFMECARKLEAEVKGAVGLGINHKVDCPFIMGGTPGPCHLEAVLHA